MTVRKIISMMIFSVMLARGHSSIMFAFRGEGRVRQNANVCEQGDGEVSHQCECSHINFFY